MDARHYDSKIILEKRQARGSIREVASELGVDHCKLHRAETGRFATYDFLCQLAEHFGVPLKRLLYATRRAA